MAALFLSHWKAFLIGGLIAAVLAIIGIQHHRINDYKTQVKNLNIQIAELTVANSQMKDATDKQNQQIKQLQDDGEAREAAAKKALDAAQAQVTAHQAKIAQIMDDHPTGDDCSTAAAVMTDYMKGGGA